MTKETENKASKVNYITLLMAVLLKPVSIFKKHLKNMTDIKVAGIYLAIVSAVAMILNLINAIFTVVRVPVRTGGGWFEAGEITGHEWVWDNISWLEAIFRNFFIYAAVIAGIALIYFLAGLILKKEVRFERALIVVTTAAIPLILTGLVLAPILGWIWLILGYTVAIAGMVYAFAILFSGLNLELDLEDDLMIYVHTICLVILAVIAYLIIVQMDVFDILSLI